VVTPDDALFPPVAPFTEAGRRTVARVQRLYGGLRPFVRKRWAVPVDEFEENPRASPWLGAVYLGYKYYVAPPRRAQGTLAAHFQNQRLDFRPPEGFQPQARLTLSAGGDLLPYEWITPERTTQLWDEVGDWFFGADLVFANLETPLDPARPPALVPEVMLNDMYFNGSPAMFDVFSGNGRYRGYDLLSTANNHSLDAGPDGLRATLDFLDARGVPHAGTARTPAEQQQIPVLERHGIRIAFLAWTSNLNKLVPPVGEEYLVNYLRLNRRDVDLTPIARQVRAARAAGADLVVASLHTGNAYQAYPSAHTVAVFHRVFRECGVDVILGGHPHNPQPMERLDFADPWTGAPRRGFAVYSLSDFVANDIFTWGRLAPMLRLTVEKGMLQGAPHTQVTEVQTRPAYLWGPKNPVPGTEQLRFLDLHRLTRQLDAGQRPPFFSDLCEREARHLRWFWKTFIQLE
jgi:poly-gamma-glutamate capsule biosynthesis protein CapA/YwtB (metallophosphatase superfamily)